MSGRVVRPSDFGEIMRPAGAWIKEQLPRYLNKGYMDREQYISFIHTGEYL